MKKTVIGIFAVMFVFGFVLSAYGAEKIFYGVIVSMDIENSEIVVKNTNCGNLTDIRTFAIVPKYKNKLKDFKVGDEIGIGYLDGSNEAQRLWKRDPVLSQPGFILGGINQGRTGENQPEAQNLIKGTIVSIGKDWVAVRPEKYEKDKNDNIIDRTFTVNPKDANSVVLKDFKIGDTVAVSCFEGSNKVKKISKEDINATALGGAVGVPQEQFVTISGKLASIDIENNEIAVKFVAGSVEQESKFIFDSDYITEVKKYKIGDAIAVEFDPKDKKLQSISKQEIDTELNPRVATTGKIVSIDTKKNKLVIKDAVTSAKRKIQSGIVPYSVKNDKEMTFFVNYNEDEYKKRGNYAVRLENLKAGDKVIVLHVPYSSKADVLSK